MNYSWAEAVNRYLSNTDAHFLLRCGCLNCLSTFALLESRYGRSSPAKSCSWKIDLFGETYSWIFHFYSVLRELIMKSFWFGFYFKNSSHMHFHYLYFNYWCFWFTKDRTYLRGIGSCFLYFIAKDFWINRLDFQLFAHIFLENLLYVSF